MKVLLDVSVFLDLLLPERGFQASASDALQILTHTDCQLLFPTSSIDTLVFILTRVLKSEKDSVSKLKNLIDRYRIHLLSSTGNDFFAIDQFSDLEDA